jgi:CheY-like chemotaxis protein
MLTELAVQLNSFDFRSVDYKTIAENARRLSGAAFVMLNKFEPDGTSFVTKAISGDNQAIQKAIDLFGDDFLKKEWPFDELRQKLVGAKKTTEFDRLSDLTGGVIPDFVINQISNLFGLGKVYVVITRNQGIRGDLTLIYPKGHFLQHQDLIEAYTDLIGMTFSRLEAERILDEQRQELQQFFSVSIDMLCVVDTQMPVMDGLEATALIRKLESDLLESRTVPIIALTAGALSEERARCVEAGMNGFLTKPIEPSVLMKVLGDHL